MRGENGGPGETPLRARREPTTNSTHMLPDPGIKPGTHWWEASTLTTAPPLFPYNQQGVGTEGF